MAPQDEAGWKALREAEFPGARFNFNPGTLGTVPRRARAAIQAFHDDGERRGYPLGQYTGGREALARARAAARALWGGPDVALGHGTTASVNLVILALARQLRERGRPPFKVLSTGHEHEGGLGGFEAHPDFAVHHVPDATLTDPAAFAATARALGAHVVFLSHVTWTEGRVVDVATLAEAARSTRPDVFVIVDAAQTLGVLPPPLEVGDLTVASGHKWLHGPGGTGFTWVTQRARERLGGVQWVGHALDPESPLGRWEPAGGQDFARWAGLASALDLYAEVGPGAARARSAMLAARWISGLHDILRRGGVDHQFFDPSVSAWVDGPVPADHLFGMAVVRFRHHDPYPAYSRANTAGLHLKCVKGTSPNGVVWNQLRAGLPWFETPGRMDVALALFEMALGG